MVNFTPGMAQAWWKTLAALELQAEVQEQSTQGVLNRLCHLTDTAVHSDLKIKQFICARIRPELCSKLELLRNTSSQVPLGQRGNGCSLFSLSTDPDPGEGSHLQIQRDPPSAQVSYLVLQGHPKTGRARL